MPRQTLAVPFGGGLDRATGQLATEPSAFADLRNVVLSDGRARVRKGLARVVGGGIAGSDKIVGLGAYRAQGRGIVALYASGTRAVRVARCSSAGSGMADVGAWFTALAVHGVPRCGVAESYGVALLTHDEFDSVGRAVTKVYDARLTSPADLVDLTGNFDGTGTNTVKFRGAVRHLAYMVGWGYGTHAIPDSPHTLRISGAGTPTAFDAEHYFQVGSPGDPIVACAQAGAGLLIFKAAETFVLSGYDRASFGVTQADPRYGCLSSRLAVTVGGRCYFWSAEGPRVSTGGASNDLAFPLDLTSAEPATLPEVGDVADGWATYDADARAVLFGFPSSTETLTRVYCCSLGPDGDDPRWSYLTLPRVIRVASQLTAAQAVLGPPGVPAIGTPTAVAGDYYATVTVPWTEGTTLGDEVVELWQRQTAPTTTAWSRVATTAVGATGASRSLSLATEQPSATYGLALRYTRGSAVSVGSESADPAVWPSGQRSSVVTPAALTVTLPPASPVVFTVSSCTVGGPVDRAVTWTGSGGAWELYEAASAPADTTVPDFSGATAIQSGAGGTSSHVTYVAVSGGRKRLIRLWIVVDGASPVQLTNGSGQPILVNDNSCSVQVDA